MRMCLYVCVRVGVCAIVLNIHTYVELRLANISFDKAATA